MNRFRARQAIAAAPRRRRLDPISLADDHYGAAVLFVTCPVCSAVAGDRCHRDGEPVGPHSDRVKAARSGRAL